MVFKKGQKLSKEARRKSIESLKKYFANGGESWNKGTKGIMKPNSTSFKKGQIPHNKGKELSKETKRKLSEYMKKAYASGIRVAPMKGKKHSKESSQKMSIGQKRSYAMGRVAPMKGKKHSKESIQKMEKTWFNTGQIPWNKDKPLSEETRMKMIRTMSTPEFRELRSSIRSRMKLPKKDTKPEKILQALCNSEGIKFQKHKWFNLGFQRAEVDLFIEPNICILADGDWVHANPNLIKHDGTMRYPPDRVLHKAGKNRPEETVLDKWANDDMITKGLQKQNYKVLRFWEYDILNNPEKCLQKIIKIIKKSRK